MNASNKDFSKTLYQYFLSSCLIVFKTNQSDFYTISCIFGVRSQYSKVLEFMFKRYRKVFSWQDKELLRFSRADIISLS